MRAKSLNRGFSVLTRSQFIYSLQNLKIIKMARYVSCKVRYVQLQTLALLIAETVMCKSVW